MKLFQPFQSSARQRYLLAMLMLAAFLWRAVPAQSDEPMKPQGGLTSVTALEARIHLVYSSHQSGTVSEYQEEATSDWSGVVRVDPSVGLCLWQGDLSVHADATQVCRSRPSKHLDTETNHGNGNDTQSMTVIIYQDRTYGFGFGNAWVSGTQSLQCEAGTCKPNPNVNVPYCVPVTIRLPLPPGGQALSGSKTFQADPGHPGTFDLTWSFAPVGKAPKLKALPRLTGNLLRGEPISLDGSGSTGKIVDYKWTFSGGKPAPDGSMPNQRAELHGQRVQVTLLDRMQVKLTVSDGSLRDSSSISAAIKPRDSFQTKVSHVSGEGTLNAPAPIHGARWTGGENVCAFDPPTDLDQPVHILHLQANGYTFAEVADQGPYSGFSFVKEWGVEVKRQSLLNKWVLEDAPPIFPGLKNFYQANLELGTDVAAYLIAARKHERLHTDYMEKSIRADDPGKFAERQYGKNPGRLRQNIDDRLKLAEQAAHKAAKDPLPSIWSGKLAVPTRDTKEWKIVLTDV